MTKFADLDDDYQHEILEAVATFHVRNGVEHEDGSRGEVRITLRELNDLLADFRVRGE